MYYTREPLILDCLELTLSVTRDETNDIYQRIQQGWSNGLTRPRHTNPTKHRYKYGYTYSVSDDLQIEVFLMPIGNGQSSVKLKLNPAHLTKHNIHNFRQALVSILGHHAYRIYYEAKVTRYDITYDFRDLSLSNYEYFVQHLVEFNNIYDDETGQLTSLTYGVYGSSCYARFYNKAFEMHKKTGDKKYLNQVWTRFELQIRRGIRFQELWSIDNDFSRIMAVDFDCDNKSQVTNFIQSHKKHKADRRKLVRLLESDYIHPIIRKHFKANVPVVCRSFKPYIEHLFPSDKKWINERTRALSLLRKLKPSDKVLGKYNLTGNLSTILRQSA